MSNGKNPQTNFGRQDGVDLRTYFEAESRMLSDAMKQRIDDLCDKINLRFENNRIALDKAEASNNLRLASMNEFRDAMKDQSGTFLTKQEYEVRHINLEEKIENMQRVLYMMIGGLAIIEVLLRFVK